MARQAMVMMRFVCRSNRNSSSLSSSSRLSSSSSSQSTATPSVRVPGPCTSTWERSAIRVKNTNVTNPYLEAIRDTHDPTMHLKTIEDELKGTIGKALGRQGEKIRHSVQRMSAQFQKYQDLLEIHKTMDHPSVQSCAVQYNEIRKQAVQARWELMVHRQAAGFIVNNHRYVVEHYPISEALPLSTSEPANQPSQPAAPKKKFGDQLDWWQRIGRWR